MSATIYRLSGGTRVPGTTTVLGVLNKPALIKWANNLGLQGIDSTRYVDELADAGTLAHDMIVAYFHETTADLSHYSEYQISLALNSFASFQAWANEREITPIAVETALVSEQYGFGGTPDLLAEVDGVATLVDFKTGKAIYPEYFAQVAAYRQLLTENGLIVERGLILRIGRTDDEGFEVRNIKSLDGHWELFTHCLSIYRLQQLLKKEEK